MSKYSLSEVCRAFGYARSYCYYQSKINKISNIDPIKERIISLHLMKKYHLISRQRRKHRYKIGQESIKSAKNHLNRVFSAKKPNQIWCGDITYEGRYRPKDLMFHSDQGCQYASLAFIENCRQKGITLSMSRRGNCWDNAPMERFFRSFKTEWMAKNYTNFEAAKRHIYDYILRYYNPKRPHMYTQQRSPIEAETTYLTNFT